MVLHNGYVTGSLFGPEWKQVQEWPRAGPSRLQGEPQETEHPVDDDDEYEEVEEEIYVTLDLGPNADPMTLGTGTEYQLIGLDTPTPYLKIGNDVFRGTPQQLIGSEIITRDTRDPLNPIKHSHPPIGYTPHRISFEPVKLTAHPSEPGPTGKDRPPMFARDVISVPKPAPKPKPKPKQPPVIPSSPPTDHQDPESSPVLPPAKKATTTSKRHPQGNAVRANPLSSHYEIPRHGEIAADGIPRIDGEKVIKRKRARKGQAAAQPVVAASPVPATDHPEDMTSPAGSSGLMQLDEPEPSSQVAAVSPIAGPSTLPATTEPLPLPLLNDPSTQLQRVLLPDAPHGYTKRGLPRRKPGPAKGHRQSSTVAREVGGVVSRLTGKLPGEEEASGSQVDGDGDLMEVDVEPESQEPGGEPDQGDIDPALL